MTAIQTPPFRADHVGSLLRPAAVMNARRKFYTNDPSISAEELKAIEDAAIVDAIRMQENLGLHVTTDGEYRRYFWHYDFMGMLTGFELDRRDEGI
tara:strand:+ start:423 stop:710 length:288 start_codon:yes stop_codon:yes gene_type:complete